MAKLITSEEFHRQVYKQRYTLTSEINIFSVAKHYSGVNIQPALGHSNYKNIREDEFSKLP